MKKNLLILIVSILPCIAIGQIDLASWNLTSNGSPSSSVSTITADSFTFTGFTNSYSINGAVTSNWNTTYQEGKFFQIALQPTPNNSAVVTSLNFRNSRSAFDAVNYKIKYYISTDNSSITTTEFFNTADNGDITLIDNGSVLYAGTNVTATFASPIYLNANQKLIIRFYGNANATNTTWTIEDGSLKVRGCVPTGTIDAYGTGQWYGSVFNTDALNAPTNYLGFVTENAIFNRNNGSNAITGLTAGICSAPSDNFFVRYKMKNNFPAGQYSITVGGDDGFRFSTDGGVSWLDGLSSYIPQSYTTKTQNICLNGNTDLVLEYYEVGGDSQVSFSYTLLSTVTAPTSLTASSTICSGVSKVLTAGGSGTFEWGSGTIGENIIAGSTGNSITVSPSGTTQYWVRKKITSPCLSYSSGLTSTVTVVQSATAPTSISSTISSCPGTAVTLTALGGTGNTYEWGTGTVGSNIISGATTVSISVSPSNPSTTYWVRRVNSSPCTGNTTAATLVYNLSPFAGDEITFGNDSWIGYVYNSSFSSPTLSTNGYLGYVTEAAVFNRNVTSGTVNGATKALCSTPSENFFVRYKMTKDFPSGEYSITVGGDDGYRFSIDGGVTWITELSNWALHSYQTKTQSICLSGTTNLVLEYFENSGNSQVSFSYTQTTTAAPTSLTAGGFLCSGTSKNLTAGGSGTFEWGTGTIGENIIAGSTGTTIAVSPTSDTQYWVRRKVTTPCLSYSTALSTTVVVVAPAIAPTSVTGTNSICSGTSTTLTANGTSGTYEWGTGTTVGTSLISGQTTSTLTISPTTTTTYWVRVKGTSPCGDSSGLTRTVTVTAAATVPTSVTGSNSICSGTSTTLTANGTSGTYEWGTGSTIGTNPIVGQTSNTLTISPTTTTTYWVRTKATSPCTADSGGITRTVTVTSLSIAPTSITGIDSSYCPGSAITLTATGGSGATYQWGSGTVLGSNVISGTGASISVSPSSTTTYWVRRVNSAPCTGYTDGVFKTVSVYPIPGDATVFGINEWNVYGYENTTLLNPTNYKGYYVQNLGSNVGFDSKLKWDDASGSPASSVDWQGCPIAGRNFTFIHKRQGFPCGQYQLAFLYYDEDTIVTVTDANGIIWTQTYTNFYDGGTGLSQAINGTNTFALNAKSTIEVRTRNTSGPGKAGLKVTSNGIATYASGSWDKPASNSPIQVNDNLDLAVDLTVCSCSVQSNKTLTIDSDKTLVVLENIVVANGGQIIVENNGALVQVDDNATYTGNATSFKMKRNTTPVFRLDYTYWSTPLNPISGYKLVDLSPNTLATKYYKWSNAWVAVNRNTEVMVPGQGYIVRAPNTFPMESSGDQPQIDNIIFTGQPNNGVITIPIDDTDEGWNLIGNPYPSALDIEEFYANSNNQSILDGTIYLWTHNTEIALSGTSYNYSKADYASYNMTGGTGTTSGNTTTPEGKVAAGQAFFIKGTALGNAEFNNSMRVRAGGQNNQFFKPGPTEVVENWQTTGKHRVWLNLTSTQNDFNQTLIGYIENATNELDWGYDGDVFSGGIVSLYSIADNKPLTIQGRALPFSNLDEVPLGYKTTLTGTLTISIDHLDGLLEGQNIYIKDNVLNVVHNLKDSEYNFTTVPGTFNDRFVLRYLPQENLNTNTAVIDENSIVVFNNNNQISIQSPDQLIDKVEIYDLNGRLLFSKNKINGTTFTTQNLNVNAQVILVKITTDTKGELVKKVIMH